MDIKIESFYNINCLKYNKNNTQIIVKSIYLFAYYICSEFIRMNTMSLCHQIIT